MRRRSVGESRLRAPLMLTTVLSAGTLVWSAPAPTSAQERIAGADADAGEHLPAGAGAWAAAISADGQLVAATADWPDGPGIYLVATPTGRGGKRGVARGAADGRLLRARMEVDVPGNGSNAQVTLRYTISIDSAVRIPLRGVRFFGAELLGVSAWVAGRRLPVELDRSRPSLISGAVQIPRQLARDRPLMLTLRYTLDRSIEDGRARFDIAVPLLLVDLAPTDAPQDMFAATIRLPSEFVIVESFPTVPKQVFDEGEMTRYVLALPVIPSMVRWRGTAGRAPRFGFARMVDLFTIGIIGLLAALGYRQVKRL